MLIHFLCQVVLWNDSFSTSASPAAICKGYLLEFVKYFSSLSLLQLSLLSYSFRASFGVHWTAVCCPLLRQDQGACGVKGWQASIKEGGDRRFRGLAAPHFSLTSWASLLPLQFSHPPYPELRAPKYEQRQGEGQGNSPITCKI